MEKAKSIRCSFCNEIFPIYKDTSASKILFFDKNKLEEINLNNSNQYSPAGGNKNSYAAYLINNQNDLSRKNKDNTVKIQFLKCPNCGKTMINLKELGTQFKEKEEIMVYPKDDGHIIYEKGIIPEDINEDYKEACAISSLSPKSSATLSRRIIEGVLTNFFGIKKGRLIDKINNLEKSQKAPDVIEDLNKIRQIGNIATHFNQNQNTMPKKFSEKEAKLMIKSIEYIFEDTYIARNKRKNHREDLDKTLSSLKK